MQNLTKINKTLNGEDLFPNTKNRSQIDMANPLNQARHNYILNLYESGLEVFLMQLDKIVDIDLFAKLSAQIITNEKDQIFLLNILAKDLANKDKDPSLNKLKAFYQAFLEAQIVIKSDHRLDIEVLPLYQRALYLNLLPYQVYRIMSRYKDNEALVEVEDLYFKNFILCPTIKLRDLDHIIPNLLKVENYQKVIEVVDQTFNDSGVVFVENLQIYIYVVGKLELDKDLLEDVYYNLRRMFKFLDKTEENKEKLINLEVSLLEKIKEFDFNFEFLTIFNTVFSDKLKFIELYEKSLPPSNSKSANYLLKLLSSNKKMMYRFDPFYLNQDQFITWYKEIKEEIKPKSYYKNFQYLLGSIYLNFCLNRDNLPNYKMLEILDSLENRSFLMGYCDNQITTLLNDVNMDIINCEIDITNSLTETNKRKIIEIYNFNSENRIEEIKGIILRADLAGFYNISPHLKKTIKTIKSIENILEEDKTMLRELL